MRMKTSMLKKRRNKVAIIYHVFAHYREPILRLMCEQDSPLPEYTIYSGKDCTEEGLKTIDMEKATLRIKDGGLRWRFLKNIWLLPSKPFLWQKGVLKIAWSKEHNTMIFLGNMYFISTWPAVILARLRKKRVLMWSHGFIRRDRGLKGCLRWLFYRLPHGMLLYGNWARNLMIEMGFDPKKLYVVFNSLDYDRQLELRTTITHLNNLDTRAKLFKNPEFPLILFVGRLTPQKQLMRIVNAAKHLTKGYHSFPVNLLFVGDGPERKVLENQLQKDGLMERVCFFGACHDECKLAPLIAAADLCVAPGEVGLTAIHSMVYGTPVITHDDSSGQGPEFEAIIPGKSGLFFRKGDDEHLAEMIRGWYRSDLNRQTIRQWCFEVIDKYYNPHFQLKVINCAVIGEKNADQLQMGPVVSTP
jgi:glycosyltransferase involved in cell wall biosynthesis